MTSIGNSAFYYCRSLTSIEIPSSVTSIGNSAFYYCSGLTSIVVELGNTKYDSRNNCNAIIETASNTLIVGCKNTMIPSSVTSIGDYAFSGCSGLTSIEIVEAFMGCSGLTSIEIPSSVTSIGSEAFSGCRGLNKVIVKDIAAWCNISFSDNPLSYAHHLYSDENTEITNLIIPSGVTSIRGGLFSNCSGLTSIVIPSSVTNIGSSAFSGCSNLTSVTSYITDIFETGKDAFTGCENATLYVPKGLANFYRITADWNRFKKIEEMLEVIPGTFVMSCNNKGKVKINGTTEFTNNVGEVSVLDGMDNTFVFTPNNNCELRQVLIDGLDVTLSVENNQLTTKVHEGSKMIVMFDKKGADVNGDGQLNISDVVALVNMILRQ